MEYYGVAGMVRAALWLDVQLGIETLGIGRGAFDRKDSCTLEASGKHLAYWVMIDGGCIFLRVQLLDAPCCALDELMNAPDTKEGWELICKVVQALERNNVKSLQRPIEAGTGPSGFVIDY